MKLLLLTATALLVGCSEPPQLNCIQTSDIDNYIYRMQNVTKKTAYYAGYSKGLEAGHSQCK